MFEKTSEPSDMEELLRNIEDLKEALSALTPETLTPEHIQETVGTLSSIDLSGSIERFSAGLPSRPEDEASAAEYDKTMRETTDRVNKAVSSANRELTRLKEWRATLDLEALDGVIETARAHVRSLYDLTSSFLGD